jgi:hypothetical protein
LVSFVTRLGRGYESPRGVRRRPAPHCIIRTHWGEGGYEEEFWSLQA